MGIAAKTRQGTPSPAALDPWRERILATATGIFARDGYQDTDLQDVADALGIGKASVYRRFPSKEVLFLAAVDDGMRRMKRSVDASIERIEDPLEQISRAVVAYLAFFDAEPELVELLILERARFKDRKIATQVVGSDKSGPFYAAEEYHQDYHLKNGGVCPLPER